MWLDTTIDLMISLLDLACVADSLTSCADGLCNGEQKRVFETDETLLFCMDIANR